MHWFTIFRCTILTICAALCGYEFAHIFQVVLKKGTYIAINQLSFDTLLSPSITLCPGKQFCIQNFSLERVNGSDLMRQIWKVILNKLFSGPAWKKLGPFINEEDFRKSVYTAEEIFHPETLAILRNKSMFDFQEQYSSYYGLCFTMQNLKPQKISDYSFQFVVNRSIDYTYYLHEPLENEWLFMSVYPYEIVLKYLDVHNDNEIYGISLIVQKQIVRKIPEKRMII